MTEKEKGNRRQYIKRYCQLIENKDGRLTLTSVFWSGKRILKGSCRFTLMLVSSLEFAIVLRLPLTIELHGFKLL